MSSPVNSPEVQVMLRWGQGFQEKDVNPVAKCLVEDFRRVVYPRFLNQKPQTKIEFIEELSEIFPTWTATVITIHSIADALKHVILHFTNNTKTKNGDNPPYESIINATPALEENFGLKIKQINEFVDSEIFLEENAFAEVKAKWE